MNAKPLPRSIAIAAQDLPPLAMFDRMADAPAPAAETLGYRRAKRGFDFLLAALMLTATLPLLLVLAVLIKLDSAGPVLFRQRRLGLNGKPFEILKLRTMTVQENGARVVQVRRHDPRVTRIGRFLRAASLDELPQLLNVLSGEMSLVGPRPHAVAHDMRYGLAIAGYADRQTVKPGITGWAQINGARGETATLDAMERRVSLDLWYVRHAGFALDLKILLRTPLEILRSRNAY